MLRQNQEFFNELHQGEQTNFSCIKGKDVKKVNGYFNEQTSELFHQLNEQGYEVFHVVNSGGYKDLEIQRFNAVFIDLDCGEAENGQYYDLTIVQKYKEEKLDQIGMFELQPSYIVETRNGLHVYWLLQEGTSVDQFKECQKKLISYFNADKAVKNPARLLRVPNFYWCKDMDNKFFTKIIKESNIRYEINEIISSLPEIDSGSLGDNNKNKYQYSISIVDSKTSQHYPSNVNHIEQKNIDVLQVIIKPEGTKVNNHNEVYDYLKKQDLQEFLGVHGNTFNCVFHEDNNPSAGVIVNEENGHQIYNCFSSNCKLHGAITIIEVVRILTGLNEVESLRLLRKIYKIEYHSSDWKVQKVQLLEANQELINSNSLNDRFPEIYAVIWRYTDVLNELIEFSKEHIYTEYFTDKYGNPVFFISTRYLASKCNKDPAKLSKIIGLFTYLGLIRKLDEKEVPEQLLIKAKKEAVKNKQKHLITFYSIPIYADDYMKYPKTKALEYKERGFTIKGWSRELVLRSLGEEEANRVYPQLQGTNVGESNNKLTSNIEIITLELIQQKGYTTEKEILQHVVQRHGRKNVYQTQIKRILSEMTQKYDLKCERATKVIKEQLGIDDVKGYPKIIY